MQATRERRAERAAGLTEPDLEKRWFDAELLEKLDALIDVWEDLGPFVGGADYDAQQGGLLALSVLAREAAVCISTRPLSLRSSDPPATA